MLCTSSCQLERYTVSKAFNLLGDSRICVKRKCLCGHGLYPVLQAKEDTDLTSRVACVANACAF